MSATLMESKVKSAESTLAFVQEEHRKTLAGLHKEIQDLQLKCSGTYTANMINNIEMGIVIFPIIGIGIGIGFKLALIIGIGFGIGKFLFWTIDFGIDIGIKIQRDF